MKTIIYCPKSRFTTEQFSKLKKLGHVIFSDGYPNGLLTGSGVNLSTIEVLALDPDCLGGFEESRERVIPFLNQFSNLKALALDTTSYGWIDLDYCKKRNISVMNIPGYSREAVAEHAIALLLCLSKKIIKTDRRTQKGQYKLEMGFELSEKTLGVIGLGNIGSRVAELGRGLGMNVVAFNRSQKKQSGVKMVNLSELCAQSDAISINLKDCAQTEGLIGASEFRKMKKGVFIVNTADPKIVDTKVMGKVLSEGKIGGYAFEGENAEKDGLSKFENVIGLRGFGWYTKEALENLFQIWEKNILSVAKGKPVNVVS